MNLQRIIYLSDAEYQTLITNGSITKNNRTITYDDNDLYITPVSGSLNSNLYFVFGTQLTSTATLVGNIAAETLINGDMINFFTPYSIPNGSNKTLTLTFNDSTTSSAIPIYTDGTNASTDSAPANSILQLVYYNNAFYLT